MEGKFLPLNYQKFGYALQGYPIFAPFATEKFQKFKLEFLVEWKTPYETLILPFLKIIYRSIIRILSEML